MLVSNSYRKAIEGLIIAWKFKRVVHKLVLVTRGEHGSKTLLFVAT
ncbi:hypothetical protein HanRHA438_Chr04g0195941 [Helianthus annuus]|nr:hypothetical protein HanIR_Chr04g0200511 [Helianthus annuus]KAJ0928607.1 hypothetical protein HanRHA438_Chr04g0195941 [Helianthus annuus]